MYKYYTEFACLGIMTSNHVQHEGESCTACSLRGSRFTSGCGRWNCGNVVTELSAKEFIDQIEVLAIFPLISVN